MQFLLKLRAALTEPVLLGGDILSLDVDCPEAAADGRQLPHQIKDRGFLLFDLRAGGIELELSLGIRLLTLFDQLSLFFEFGSQRGECLCVRGERLLYFLQL